MTDKQLLRKFLELKERWELETTFTSSAQDICHSLSYLQIIGLGPSVIPLILNDLQKGPAHWFVALLALTRNNPVPDNVRGDMKKMTDLWLEWGRENNIMNTKDER